VRHDPWFFSLIESAPLRSGRLFRRRGSLRRVLPASFSSLLSSCGFLGILKVCRVVGVVLRRLVSGILEPLQLGIFGDMCLVTFRFAFRFEFCFRETTGGRWRIGSLRVICLCRSRIARPTRLGECRSTEANKGSQREHGGVVRSSGYFDHGLSSIS
jgi:hypothetical protein